MTTLNAATQATSSTATEGDVKNFLTNLRTFIADLLGSDSGNAQSVLQALKTLLNGTVFFSGDRTVVNNDRGKVLVYTGAGGNTLSTAPVATLGDGFVFSVVNRSSGALTINPNLTEQINGVLTYVVQPTETVIVYCDGTEFSLFGKAPASIVNSINGRTGAQSILGSDTLFSAGAVGSYAIGYGAGGASTTQGTTYAGSSITRSNADGSAFISAGLTGTWMCVSSAISPAPTGIPGLFQRIS